MKLKIQEYKFFKKFFFIHKNFFVVLKIYLKFFMLNVKNGKQKNSTLEKKGKFCDYKFSC